MVVVNCNNLEAEMKRIGVTRADIAKCINCSYRTVHSRFNGESQWLYDECVSIRDAFFPDMAIGYLFPYSNDTDKKPTLNDIRKEHGLQHIHGGDVTLTKV